MRPVALIALLCIAASLPPLPKKHVVPLTQGSASKNNLSLLKASIAKLIIIIPKLYRLVWEPNGAPVGTLYQVEAQTSLTSPWGILGQTTSCSWSNITATETMRFYRVGAMP